MIKADVFVELPTLKAMGRELGLGLRGTAPGPIRKAFKQWGFRFRSFLQQRFVKYSRGAGWPPLKRKRKRGSLAEAAILRDTNTMFMALDPSFKGLPGQMEVNEPYGILAGYGGPHRHPKAGISVADLAAIHDQGLGNVPKREIIVTPPSNVVSAMADDMQRALLSTNE